MKLDTPRYRVVLERDSTYVHEQLEIDHPMKLYDYVAPIIRDESQEVFLMVALDTKLNPIGVFEVHRGTISSSLVNLGDIAKRLLLVNASRVIFAHNHPSGDTSPSQADVLTTDAIREMLELFDIGMVDHIIVGDDECYSLQAQSKFYVED